MATSRRLPRSVDDVGKRGMSMAMYLGPRWLRVLLAAWFVGHYLARAAYRHPKRALAALAFAVVVGVVGSVTVAVCLLATLGWGLLAYERRGDPDWRKVRAGRPWRRRPITANGKRWPWWRGSLDSRGCLLWGIVTGGILLWWLPLAVGTLAIVPASLMLLQVVKLHRPLTSSEKWTDEKALLAMLTDPEVNVLAPAKAGEKQAWLRRIGTPHTDEDGNESVRLQFEGGVHYSKVVSKQQAMTAYYDLPAGLFRAVHEKDTPVSWVKLERRVPRVSTAGGPSPLCKAKQTNALDPARIGEDEDTYLPLYLPTYEANSLIAGIMGSGKSELARMLIGHYLLDPRAWVAGCDGKGSRKDYQDVARMSWWFVNGVVSESPATELTEGMRRVYQLVRWRNANDDGRQDYTPGLIVLEEVQDILANATPAELDELVDTIAQVERMGRAVNVHIAVITQRTSVDDLPAKIRNLLSNRVALMTMNTRDYPLVLGLSGTPDVRLPKAKQGEGILRLPTGQHALIPDRLPLDQWQALCARAKRLRPEVVRPECALDVVSGVQDEVDPFDGDPFGLAVWQALQDGPLSATELWEQLPAHLRPVDARTLGVVLGRGYAGVFEQKRTGDKRLWTVTATVTRKVTAPSRDGLRTLVTAGPAGLDGRTVIERDVP